MDATRLLPSATAYATPWVACVAASVGGAELALRASLASLAMAFVGLLGAHASRRFVAAARAGSARLARAALVGRTAFVAGTGLGLVTLLGPVATGFGVASLAVASGVVAVVGALQTHPGRAAAQALETAC